nr:hypothetical protein Itr_chr02CG08410 [Ipomoea trifida]
MITGATSLGNNPLVSDAVTGTAAAEKPAKKPSSLSTSAVTAISITEEQCADKPIEEKTICAAPKFVLIFLRLPTQNKCLSSETRKAYRRGERMAHNYHYHITQTCPSYKSSDELHFPDSSSSSSNAPYMITGPTSFGNNPLLSDAVSGTSAAAKPAQKPSSLSTSAVTAISITEEQYSSSYLKRRI